MKRKRSDSARVCKARILGRLLLRWSLPKSPRVSSKYSGQSLGGGEQEGRSQSPRNLGFFEGLHVRGQYHLEQTFRHKALFGSRPPHPCRWAVVLAVPTVLPCSTLEQSRDTNS